MNLEETKKEERESRQDTVDKQHGRGYKRRTQYKGPTTSNKRFETTNDHKRIRKEREKRKTPRDLRYQMQRTNDKKIRNEKGDMCLMTWNGKLFLGKSTT